MDAPVAVVNGYAHHELLQRDFPELNLHPVNSPDRGLQKLTEGDVDAFIGFLITADHIIRENEWANLKIAGGSPYAFSFHLGVRSNWPELVDILNKGIGSFKPADHARISQTWLSTRYKKGIDYALVWKIVLSITSISALGLALILAWNRQVRKREERFRSLLETAPDGMIIADTSNSHKPMPPPRANLEARVWASPFQRNSPT